MKYKTYLLIGEKEIDITEEMENGLFNFFQLLRFRKIGYVNNPKYKKSVISSGPSLISEKDNIIEYVIDKRVVEDEV